MHNGPIEKGALPHVVTAFLVLVCAGSCEKDQVEIPRPSEERHLLVCPAPAADFGQRFRPVGPIEHSFVLKNLSSKAITLKVASSSCACTKAVLREDSISPGGQTNLDVTWTVKNLPGQHGFDVSIRTITPLETMLVLGGKVAVCDIVRVAPLRVDFGVLRPGEIRKKEVTVSRGSSTAALETMGLIVRGQPKGLKATAVALNENMMRLALTATGSPGEGTKTYQAVLQTHSPEQPEIEIPVEVKHLPNYEIVPSSVAFGTAGGEKTERCTIRANIPKTPVVERIIVDKPSSVSASVGVGESNESQIVLSLLEAGSSPILDGKIEIFLQNCDETLLLRYVVL